MTITYDWTIQTCEHEIATGGITIAHWRVVAQDGEYSALAYGTASFTPDPQSETFKPYNQVTQEEVLSWVYGQVDKASTELTLANQIAQDMNPVIASGTPWSQ